VGEGLQAGRLEVPVVADLAGFAQKLRTQVETVAEGLAVKVKVKVDDKNLRKRLQTAVKEASKGVTATVRVKIDQAGVLDEIDAIRRRVADADINLPVRPDGDDRSAPGGGLLGNLRRIITGAQGEADRNPVNVPVQIRLPRGRGTLRMLAMGALVALAQPAVAALGQYAAGLTALVSAAAPAVGVLGPIPGLISAIATAAVGTKVAFSGFGDALKESLKAQAELAAEGKLTEAQQKKLDQALGKLSKSARSTVTTVTSLAGAWRAVKQSVQERFFSKVADDVKPLSNAVLPLLNETLGDSAAQLGGLAERGADFMKTGVFRKDFKTIAGTNSKVIGNMVNGLANLGRASMDFLVASGPAVERVGAGAERFTQWARSSAAAARETGSLDRFLNRALDKASQLGRISRELFKGVVGVGRAGQESGDALLNGLEGTMQRFNRWANSRSGQVRMKQFFSDAAPTFHELNRLAGDFFRGLGRMARDSGVTDLVRQIRLELMPALGGFFNSVGQSVGPGLISFISNIATAIGHLASAGVGLGLLLQAFSGLLKVANDLMDTIPGLGTAIGLLLGGMLALKVITGVANMLRGFGASVRTAATATTGLGTALRTGLGPGVIGPQITGWQRVGMAYQGAAQHGNRLTGTLRGVAAANRAVSVGVGGMMAALGGPLGLVVTGLTIGLGLLATRQAAAARAAQAHEERVKSLSQALAASNGVIDANVRAQAAQLLQDTKLGDGKTKLVDVLRDADVELRELTDAYLEQDGTIGGLQKRMSALAEANKTYQQYGREYVLQYDEQGKRYKAAAEALGQVNGELAKTRAAQKDLAAAVNGAGETGTSAYDRLTAAVQGFSDKTSSADTRVDALKRALDELAGNTMSVHEAGAQLNAVMLQIDDALKGNIDQSQGWGAALIGANGLVNTTTRNGQSLNTQLTELRNSVLLFATRAQEAADQGLMPLDDALAQSQTQMESARAKAIELAIGMGIPRTEAEALANQLGLVPSTVTTLMQTQGIPQATAEFLALQIQLGNLGKGQSIRITAPTLEARSQLEALGFTVQRVPGTKDIVVTAPTGGARANINALASDIASAPDKKSVTVDAVVKRAADELQGVRDKVVNLPPGRTVKVTAPTKLAQEEIKALGYKVRDLKGKEIEITAPNKTPIQQVQAIQDRINNLRGRTVDVIVRYSPRGQAYVDAAPKADGGIVHFANGGIRRAGDRVKAFANGTERHIAQIAKPGEWRLWAEPETGGEAYVPLSPAKRTRSKAIVEEVVRQFGGVVAWANGALRQYADGAVTINRSTRASAPRASAPRASAPQAPRPALIGGDLNLTMTAAPMTPAAALSDALVELRRIRLGGAHVAS
jgi:hypothetical protein